ncbi:MAG TPA: hypothetical protein VHW09_10285 [Bryobacteraceae bacterium]|jgi:hypothetical protein|nr:hypothetical protein [Bryobacteraceae bacterium]
MPWKIRHPRPELPLRNPMQKRRASRFLLPAVWFALLGVGSFIPFAWKLHLHIHGPLHLPAHFLVFLISGLVACGAASSQKQRIAACAAVIVYACAIEILEARVFGNSLEWIDMLVDASAVILAYVWQAFRHPQEGF